MPSMTFMRFIVLQTLALLACAASLPPRGQTGSAVLQTGKYPRALLGRGLEARQNTCALDVATLATIVFLEDAAHLALSALGQPLVARLTPSLVQTVLGVVPLESIVALTALVYLSVPSLPNWDSADSWH
ncbi:hypothetical protein DL96DRAFT_1708294 [Flagelloscypha sp. PMI_526]|nr:hypothetical protein DL96DRAFT_1708294 [Flagelloscypha sp. PMI_526]